MATRPNYTQQQRDDAIALYADHGPSEAQRRCGIPKSTITRWAKNAGVSTTVPAAKTAAATEAALKRAEKLRMKLRVRLMEKAHDLLDRMDREHIDFKGAKATEVTFPLPSPAGVQNYATALAILIDKYRLEVGEATSRNEHVDKSELDREIERLLQGAKQT